MSDELKALAEHYAQLRSRAIRGPYSAWPDAEGRVIRPHSESGERNEKMHDGSIAFVDCELDDAKMDATAQLMAAAWEMADLIRDQQAEIERLRGGAVPAPGCAVAEAFDRVIQQAGALGPHSQEDALVLARWWRSIFTAPPAPAVPSTRWSKSAARQWMEAVCTKSASPADRFLAVAAHVAGQRYALGESHESTLSHPDGEGAEVTPAPVAPDGVAKMRELLRRYRTETPLCHQPHMIALEVDELLAAAPEVPR